MSCKCRRSLERPPVERQSYALEIVDVPLPSAIVIVRKPPIIVVVVVRIKRMVANGVQTFGGQRAGRMIFEHSEERFFETRRSAARLSILPVDVLVVREGECEILETAIRFVHAEFCATKRSPFAAFLVGSNRRVARIFHVFVADKRFLAVDDRGGWQAAKGVCIACKRRSRPQPACGSHLPTTAH